MFVVVVVVALILTHVLSLFGEVEAVPLAQLDQSLHVSLTLWSQRVSLFLLPLVGERQIEKDEGWRRVTLLV